MTFGPKPGGAEPSPHLDIIVVNWNSGGLLRDCVASIAPALRPGVTLGRLVVVDNASDDDSADDLPGNGLPLTVLRNAKNRGFAAACNQGAAGSRADHLLFLNPDARLSPDSLAAALAFLDAPSQRMVGALGVRLVGEDGVTQRCCARAPTPGRLAAQSVGLDRLFPRLFPPHFMTEWDHDETRDVDQVMGAFLLIRRPLFEAIGGFDERYFVYFDDVDLCLSVRLAGRRVVHFAGTTVYHRGGGTTDRVRDIRLFYGLRSRLLFAAKRFSGPATLLVTLATLLGEPVARLAQGLARRAPDDVRATLRGVGMLWRDLPAILPAMLDRSRAERVTTGRRPKP